MAQKGNLFKLLAAGLLAGSLALTGCSGDDGSQGPQGLQGEPGEPGPVTTTSESCNVCHGTEDSLAIAEVHPAAFPKAVVSNIVVASGAGATDTVTFDVFEDDGATPISGLTINDLRFYLADIVPAGTDTATTFADTANPITTWETPQFERWLYERSGDSYPTGTLVENLDGSYTYTFVGDLAAGDAAAPDFSVGHTQRLLIRVDPGAVADFQRTIGLLDFVIPADGEVTTDTGVTREIVTMAACTACHGDPLENAAHGGGYQSPQACNVCHTPLGNEYGDEMQAMEAWSASLFHKIHAAIDMEAFPTRIGGEGYSAVTYPKDIKNCEVCHFDAGQDMADAWKTNPTAEVCTTCHIDSTVTVTAGVPSITHSEAAIAQGAPSSARDNSTCNVCHGPADIEAYHDTTITKEYDSTISLSADDDDTPAVYEAGDQILVTVTVTDLETGEKLADYADAEAFNRANLYVYGPRAEALPVLTTGSTTDPAFIAELETDHSATPSQGHDMLVDSEDPQVLTDAEGFKYQLLTIPEDLAPGTYMVQVAVDHDASRRAGSRNYAIDGWALTTFQVGTATEEPRAAGVCTDCHTQEDWGSMYHRSYFGTDGCIACHDQSGNHADPLANRVHAVHSASEQGDLLGADWSFITYPRDLESCQACHNSGDDSYHTEPEGSWGIACIGCHGDTAGTKDHMLQNGAPFSAEH